MATFFFFFLQILVLRVNFDEESNGDGLEAQKIFLLVLRATFMKIEEKIEEIKGKGL